MSADTTLAIVAFNTKPNARGKRRMYRVVVVQAAENFEAEQAFAYDYAQSYLDRPGTEYRSLERAKRAAEKVIDSGEVYLEYGGPIFYFVNHEEKRVQPMRRDGVQYDRPVALEAA